MVTMLDDLVLPLPGDEKKEVLTNKERTFIGTPAEFFLTRLVFQALSERFHQGSLTYEEIRILLGFPAQGPMLVMWWSEADLVTHMHRWGFRAMTSEELAS